MGFVVGRMGCFVFCYGWQSGQKDLLVIAFIWNDSKCFLWQEVMVVLGE